MSVDSQSFVEEKRLGRVISRRHPFYQKKLSHWNFLEACYEGGREWFDANIFRYIKEGDKDYQDRVKRAYRFNHSKEIVNLVNKYIFKAKVIRNEENAPEPIVKFWKKATKGGDSIEKLTRQFAKEASVFGRVWIVVDNNKIEGIVSKEDEEQMGVRSFAYSVKPQNVLDMSFDHEGDLNWILIHETIRDDEDPFESTGVEMSRFRLWTRDSWYLMERLNTASPSGYIPSGGVNTNQELAIQVDSGYHGLGFVPVFPHDHNESDEVYFSPSLIDDIAYLDRASANYLSNLDAIIQDQSFSQLAMPAQGLLPGEDAYSKLVEMGTKRIFLYDGEHGGAPSYLSPDPKQAELIVTVISKIVNEIYHTVGMAGERTKQDNAVGIDNSSGVAKAYDFERVNALLTSKAFSIKKTEVRILKTVMLWNGVNMEEAEIEKLLTYPDTFDIRGIADEFDIAEKLTLVCAPMGMKKEQMKALVDKLFPQIKDDLKQELIKEIDDMKDPLLELAAGYNSNNKSSIDAKINGQPNVKPNTSQKA